MENHEKDGNKFDEKIILSKFALIGLSGVLVNFAVLYLLSLIISEQFAVALAIYASMTSNYIFNRIWTFKSKGKIPIEYLKYLASALLGSLIQYLVTIYLTSFFRDALDIDYLPFIKIDIIYFCSAIGIGLGFVTNYILSKYFVFDLIKKS